MVSVVVIEVVMLYDTKYLKLEVKEYVGGQFLEVTYESIFSRVPPFHLIVTVLEEDLKYYKEVK